MSESVQGLPAFDEVVAELIEITKEENWNFENDRIIPPEMYARARNVYARLLAEFADLPKVHVSPSGSGCVYLSFHICTEKLDIEIDPQRPLLDLFGRDHNDEFYNIDDLTEEQLVTEFRQVMSRVKR